MSETAAPKPVYCFYHLQGERGESAAHPNAFRVTCATPGRVSLSDVLSSFPLAGTSSFHFRFQMKVDTQSVFLDLGEHPDDAVPTVNGSIIAKVLRLGACCARTHSAASRRRQGDERDLSRVLFALSHPPNPCPLTKRACRHRHLRQPPDGEPGHPPAAAGGW